MPRFNKFDICLAWYMYASHYHGGQFTKLYQVFGRLERIKFRASIMSKLEDYFDRELSPDEDRKYDEYENARAIYESLVERKVYQ
jgi:hypothetical protein